MALSDPDRAHVCERVEGEPKGQTPAPGTEPCFVYILKCADGSYYVGSTTDVAERERVHNEGHGAVYTATRRPVRLVYSEAHQSWPSARKREAQLADIEAW
jgi:putative endonuclease